MQGNLHDVTVHLCFLISKVMKTQRCNLLLQITVGSKTKEPSVATANIDVKHYFDFL